MGLCCPQTFPLSQYCIFGIYDVAPWCSVSQFLSQMELLQNFYETTLDALQEAKNDRLWFKTNTKLGKLYFEREEFSKLQKILKQLRVSCQTDDGEDDLKKGTQLLEIYALEIQMYTAQKNNKKLKVHCYSNIGKPC